MQQIFLYCIFAILLSGCIRVESAVDAAIDYNYDVIRIETSNSICFVVTDKGMSCWPKSLID